MKSWLLFLLLAVVLLVSACENVDVSKLSQEDINKVIVCNPPYMRFASSCCLDQNQNGVCDTDENGINKEVATKEIIVETPKSTEEAQPSKAIPKEQASETNKGVSSEEKGETVFVPSLSLDLAEYPSQFIKDNGFNAVIVVGNDATDSIAAVDIATSITYAKRAEGQEIEIGSAKLANEIRPEAVNVISIGSPCDNTVTAKIMGVNEANCKEGLIEGKAVIKFYQNENGNIELVVTGANSADVRRASRVLANYKQWQEADKLKGTQVEVTGTSLTDIEVNAPTPDILAGCTEVLLKVSEIDGTPQICYGGSGTGGYVEFTLDNHGKKDIKELGIVIGGQSSIYQNSSLNGSAIISRGALFRNISYDYTSYGKVKYVRFIPKIEINGVVDVCSSSALQIESNQLVNCSAR